MFRSFGKGSNITKARPDLREWSGFDWLWIDVGCDVKGAELRLALEDDVIEPPVLRTFTVPADQ